MTSPASSPSASFQVGISAALAVVSSAAASHYSLPQILPADQSPSSLSTSLPLSFFSFHPSSLSFPFSFGHLLTLLLLLWSLRNYYNWFWRPLQYSRPLTPSQRAEALTRSYSDLPPPYPNSWFKLCDSFLVEPNQSKQFEMLGHIFTLTRTPITSEFAGLNGMRRKSEEEREEGEEINSVVTCVDEKGKNWTVQEVNKMVFIWNDEQNAEPTWKVPVAVEGGMKNWRFHGKVTQEIICHIIEIAENGADTAHLNFVHGGFITDELLGFLGRFLPDFRHTWAATWTPQAAPNNHIAEMCLHTGVSLWDKIVPMIAVDSHILQIGPGIVQLCFQTPFGKILIQECMLPIATNLQRAENVVWAEPNVPRFMAKFVLNALSIQFERDFPIWNNKRWVRAPLAVREDGPILKYRRWAKQFYYRDGGRVIRDADGKERFEKRGNKVDLKTADAGAVAPAEVIAN